MGGRGLDPLQERGELNSSSVSPVQAPAAPLQSLGEASAAQAGLKAIAFHGIQPFAVHTVSELIAGTVQGI